MGNIYSFGQLLADLLQTANLLLVAYSVSRLAGLPDLASVVVALSPVQVEYVMLPELSRLVPHAGGLVGVLVEYVIQLPIQRSACALKFVDFHYGNFQPLSSN